MGCHTWHYIKSAKTKEELKHQVSICNKKGNWEDSNEYHDTFRVWGYPNDKLYSYKDTLDFIEKFEKKNDYKIELLLNEKTRKTYLEEFWNQYPDGAIDFG